MKNLLILLTLVLTSCGEGFDIPIEPKHIARATETCGARGFRNIEYAENLSPYLTLTYTCGDGTKIIEEYATNNKPVKWEDWSK